MYLKILELFRSNPIHFLQKKRYVGLGRYRVQPPHSPPLSPSTGERGAETLDRKRVTTVDHVGTSAVVLKDG